MNGMKDSTTRMQEESDHAKKYHNSSVATTGRNKGLNETSVDYNANIEPNAKYMGETVL